MTVEVADITILEGMEELAKDKPYMMIPYLDGELNFVISIPTEEEFDFLLAYSNQLKKLSITELKSFVRTGVKSYDDFMCYVSVIAIADRMGGFKKDYKLPEKQTPPAKKKFTKKQRKQMKQ